MVHGDDRGFFMESWNARDFSEIGIDAQFVQDNHSCSSRGVLRGLHYQIGTPQGKLLRVTRGSVYDVAVDLRRGSVYFGKWMGVQLSDENRRILWIPPGFAHGFYVTSDEAEFQYKCTEYYSAEDDRAIRWDDPGIGIVWPLLEGEPPLLSPRDAEAPLLKDAEVFG
jgi:dTDP-4-dehydrorhamnose 3,5-epimerase